MHWHCTLSGTCGCKTVHSCYVSAGQTFRIWTLLTSARIWQLRVLLVADWCIPTHATLTLHKHSEEVQDTSHMRMHPCLCKLE